MMSISDDNAAANIAIVRGALDAMRSMRQAALGRPLTVEEDNQVQRELATMPNEALVALANASGGGYGGAMLNSQTRTKAKSAKLEGRNIVIAVISFLFCGIIFGAVSLGVLNNGSRIVWQGLVLSAVSFAFAGGTIWFHLRTRPKLPKPEADPTEREGA